MLAPDGAATPVTELNGEVFDRAGEHLLGGTVVAAYVGDVLCGIGSVRRVGNFAGYMIRHTWGSQVSAANLRSTQRHVL